MNESKEIKELIPIEDRNGQKAVSARMLHAFFRQQTRVYQLDKEQD